jgi:hypothetical protein
VDAAVDFSIERTGRRLDKASVSQTN